MLITHHDTKTLQEFVDLFARRRLNLSPAFQRQSVWNTTDRRLLVQSLLEGIPIPSIYLYRRVGHGGSPVYEVIDGKQRLETLLLFRGKGPLARQQSLEIRASLDDGQQSTWWAWQDLPKATRNSLLTTRIPTIEVEGDLAEIINLFVRINSTGKRLEGQEKRHALYYTSPVLKTAQQVAESFRPYLLKHSVLTEAQVQRMKHVELVTELLLGVNAGTTHLNKKGKIDEIIQGGGLDSQQLRPAVAHVRRAIGLVEATLPDLKTTRFRRLADFYSLTILLHRYRDEGSTLTTHDSARNMLAGALLRDFGRGVDQVAERSRRGAGATTNEEPFRQYLMTVREGTDSSAQRRSREQLLREVLDGVFEPLDSSRTFNATQRRIMWHASEKKTCSLCGQPIARWEDMSVDHITPFMKGGRTTLKNAALAHRRCNSAKGDRT